MLSNANNVAIEETSLWVAYVVRQLGSQLNLCLSKVGDFEVNRKATCNMALSATGTDLRSTNPNGYQA